MSRGTGNKRPKDSSIFATFKFEQDEEEDREMHLRDLQPPKMPIQECFKQFLHWILSLD